jgi:hypothetical protein
MFEFGLDYLPEVVGSTGLDLSSLITDSTCSRSRGTQVWDSHVEKPKAGNMNFTATNHPTNISTIQTISIRDFLLSVMFAFEVV